MAAQATSHGARLRQLQDAKARADALPRKARLSFEPMMELLGLSARKTLREWCDLAGVADSGTFVRGGNGIAWEFEPRRFIAAVIKHFEAVVARQNRKSREMAKAVGVDLPADEAPSIPETKQLVELTLTLTAAREKQGAYTVADEVADFLSGYNEELVNGILGVKTKVDPNGNLPPAVRKAMDEELRRLATALHAKAASYIEAQRNAGTEQRRAG